MSPRTARQALADALGVPLHRVRADEFGDAMATTGKVRWTLYHGSVSAHARNHRYVSSPVTKRHPVAAAVAECRLGLTAMGAPPPLVLRWEGDVLYARQAGDPSAIGWARDNLICVYEPVGNDEIKHRHSHPNDPRDELVATLARYWPGVPVVQVPK